MHKVFLCARSLYSMYNSQLHQNINSAQWTMPRCLIPSHPLSEILSMPSGLINEAWLNPPLKHGCDCTYVSLILVSVGRESFKCPNPCFPFAWDRVRSIHVHVKSVIYGALRRGGRTESLRRRERNKHFWGEGTIHDVWGAYGLCFRTVQWSMNGTNYPWKGEAG